MIRKLALLSMCLAVLAFAGCGGGGGVSQPTTMPDPGPARDVAMTAAANARDYANKALMGAKAVDGLVGASSTTGMAAQAAANAAYAAAMAAEEANKKARTSTTLADAEKYRDMAKAGEMKAQEQYMTARNLQAAAQAAFDRQEKVGFATAKKAAAQTRERMWTVTCGLPKQDNPFLALLSRGNTDPWFGDTRSGHLRVKMFQRLHPEGGVSTEMWVLSRNVGWWRLKAIRVHPEDRSKLSDLDNAVKGQGLRGIRQIIESPFLSQPAMIRAMNLDEEELVTGQILALMPDASRLQCAAPRRRKETSGS